MSAAGLERPQVVVHAQQSLNYTVFDCKWVPRSARLLCLGSAPRGTGVLQLYELRGGRLLLLSEVSGGRSDSAGRPREAEGSPLPPARRPPRLLPTDREGQAYKMRDLRGRLPAAEAPGNGGLRGQPQHLVSAPGPACCSGRRRSRSAAALGVGARVSFPVLVRARGPSGLLHQC